MRKHLIALVLLCLLFLNLGCKKSPTEVEKPPLLPTLELSLDDVTCTEAWIKIKKQNDTSFLPISLTLNEKEFYGGFLKGEDTIFFVENLKASTSYSVKGTIQTGQQETKEIKVTTLPTTSHNFTWQTFTFGGDAGSSGLSDVAIIDENNIWAVGEIYMNDSLGNPDPHAYNAAHWDGSKWEAKKISVLFRGSYITPPLEGICAFSSSDIWFVGSLPIHGDGNNWTMYDLRTTLNPNLSLSKAWGSNSSNIYFVGRVGSIAHYDGKNWQKIESGTTFNINDVFGGKGNDGNNFIFCSAYNFGSGGGKKFIKIEGTTVTEINWLQNKELYTCWFKTPNKLYAGGEGLYYNIHGNWKEDVVSNFFVFRVRGTGLNDIWSVGGYGYVAHFNGTSWRVFDEVALMDGNYYGLTVRENLICVVGREGGKAVITLGRKY